MKKTLSMLLIVIFTMGITSAMLSQETEKTAFNTKKTEVNIAIANIFAKNYIYPYYLYDGDLVYPYFDDFNAPRTKLIAGLKFHNPKGAVRLAAEFSYNSRKFDNGDNDATSSSYRMLDAGFNLGYEWHSTFNRVNIYYGFDLSAAHTNYSYINTINDDEHTTRSREISYGLSPLVGVNFFITPNLSIGTEMKFMTEAFTGKTIYEYNGEEQDTDKSSGFRTQFGPLGFLSFNIHF
jgi:hypothetical protein